MAKFREAVGGKKGCVSRSCGARGNVRILPGLLGRQHQRRIAAVDGGEVPSVPLPVFIPFGRTSDLQLNDKVFHHPMKVDYRSEANAWFLLFYRKLREMVTRGEITEHEKLLRLTKALCLSVLREKMPFWLLAAVTKTLTLDNTGNNAVSTAWETVYFGPARAPGVLGKALARREAEAAIANGIELAAATAAAAAAAAAVVVGGGDVSAAIEAGATAATAAKAAHRAALSPLVAALAAQEIALHDFDIPEVSGKAATSSLVQRKSKASGRHEVLLRVKKAQALERTDAVVRNDMQPPLPFSPHPR